MSQITNLLKSLSQKQKANYVGPLTVSGHVAKDAPFKIKFAEDQLGPTAREAIDTFKGVDLPGTEAWLYPRRSLTWYAKGKEWHGINTLGNGDNTLVAIPLRDWLQDASVMQLMDDDSKIGTFKWYLGGKHIAEAEAVAINDQFDVSTYGLQVTSPVRKRSFDPVASTSTDPVASTSTDDVNRLLDEGTPEAADSAALLLATQQAKRHKL